MLHCMRLGFKGGSVSVTNYLIKLTGAGVSSVKCTSPLNEEMKLVSTEVWSGVESHVKSPM